MAHVRAYGRSKMPQAAGIIHLGATKLYVTRQHPDLMLDARRLTNAGWQVSHGHWIGWEYSRRQYRDLPCLGFTHLQPAQPTTIGKRACLWAADLAMDLHEVEHRLEQLKARGVKGATGTQASFLELFAAIGLRRMPECSGWSSWSPRKWALRQCILSLGKRIRAKWTRKCWPHCRALPKALIRRRPTSEFWPHGRNWKNHLRPSRSAPQHGLQAQSHAQRTDFAGLARFVMSLETSAVGTASTQWLERTLDDSANRRLVIPQAFLAIDAILILYQNIASGLVVYPK